jgi:hypothetical protein
MGSHPCYIPIATVAAISRRAAAATRRPGAVSANGERATARAATAGRTCASRTSTAAISGQDRTQRRIPPGTPAAVRRNRSGTGANRNRFGCAQISRIEPSCDKSATATTAAAKRGICAPTCAASAPEHDQNLLLPQDGLRQGLFLRQGGVGNGCVSDHLNL